MTSTRHMTAAVSYLDTIGDSVIGSLRALPCGALDVKEVCSATPMSYSGLPPKPDTSAQTQRSTKTKGGSSLRCRKRRATRPQPCRGPLNSCQPWAAP